MSFHLINFIPLLWVSFLNLVARKTVIVTLPSSVLFQTQEGYNITWIKRKCRANNLPIWRNDRAAGCLIAAQGTSVTLVQPSLVYRPRTSDRLFCEARILKDCSSLGKVRQWPYFVSCSSNLDSMLSAVEARAVSCPVANFATININSIWRFFNAHHLFLK